MDEAQNINDEIVKMEPIKPKSQKFDSNAKVSWWRKIASEINIFEKNAKEEIPLSGVYEEDSHFKTLDEKMRALPRTGPTVEDFPSMAASLTRTTEEIINALDDKLNELQRHQVAIETQTRLLNDNIKSFRELVRHIKYHL